MPRFPTSKEYTEFAAQVAVTRKACGLTQHQLAEMLGRPQSYIAKIERAERRVDIVEFLELIDAMNTDPIPFFDRIRRSRAL